MPRGKADSGFWSANQVVWRGQELGMERLGASGRGDRAINLCVVHALVLLVGLFFHASEGGAAATSEPNDELVQGGERQETEFVETVLTGKPHQVLEIPSLEGVERLELEFGAVDVRLRGSGRKGKGSSPGVRVSLVSGAPDRCGLAWKRVDHVLALRSENGDCIYSVGLNMATSLPVQLKLAGDSHVELDPWDSDVTAQLDRGLMSFSKVQSLHLNCSRCDLSGEEVRQGLTYRIDCGTVGVRRVKGGISGQSKGDVLVEAMDMGRMDKVDIKTSMGDIYLSLPARTLLKPILLAPKGEVVVKVPGHPELREHGQSSWTGADQGNDFKLSAQLGSIHLTQR